MEDLHSGSRCFLDHATTFDERDEMIGGTARESFFETAGPGNVEVLHGGGRAETKMQSQIIIGDIARSAALFLKPGMAAGRYSHTRANSVAVRFCALQHDANPVIAVGRKIHKQQRLFVNIVDDGGLPAIVP